VQVGFLTVLLVGICFFLLRWGVATHRIGRARRLIVYIALPLAGLVLARWMRWLSK